MHNADIENRTDHLGKLHPSENAMCAAHGVPLSTYKGRLSRGWTKEQALSVPRGGTDRKVNKRDGRVPDHLGNLYPSIAAMCRAWDLSEKVYWSRKRLLKWPLEKILTTPVRENEDAANAVPVQDHEGREFRSISAMCRYWEIGLSTYRERRKRGWDVERALTGKQAVIAVDAVPSEDFKGVSYPSKNAMCAAYGITRYCYESRLALGWSQERALTEPLVINAKPCEDHTGKAFPASVYMALYLGFPKYAFHRTDRDPAGLIPGFAAGYWPGRRIGTLRVKSCAGFPWFLVSDGAGDFLMSFDAMLDEYHKSGFMPLPETNIRNPALRVVKPIQWPWYLCDMRGAQIVLDYDGLVSAHAGLGFVLAAGKR